jgi:hypothetical protein
MSARIVVNLTDGVAQSAIDRAPDGGTWLSLWQGREVVIVKLTRPSLQALHQMLGRELGAGVASESATPATAPDESVMPARDALAMRPCLPIPDGVSELFRGGSA